MNILIAGVLNGFRYPFRTFLPGDFESIILSATIEEIANRLVPVGREAVDIRILTANRQIHVDIEAANNGQGFFAELRD
jgi:hypothetical protein